MGVRIKSVVKGSLAEQRGITESDILKTINRHEIVDVLDYRLYISEPVVTLGVVGKDKSRLITIKKQEDEDIGLEFETYLMDEHRSCLNKCIFCFIDQMPPNMRSSLYFKDDDARLSFLFGNYITLTNMDQKEIDRIISLKISPINISVHTTNPSLRCIMMNNKNAGSKLSYIKQLTSAGITVNCQIVLCPGINDGPQLQSTLEALARLGDNIGSVACVPVGLTKYRDGLYPLTGYDRDGAREVIAIIDEFNAKLVQNGGRSLAYPADEFFILAKKRLPELSYYGELSQLANGVGMLALFINDFKGALDRLPNSDEQRHVSIATGVAFSSYLRALVEKLKDKHRNLVCDIYPIKNKHFGESITVTGLLTGNDIINQLKGRRLGETLLISECMLSHEQDKFLDDVTVEDMEKVLSVKVTVVPNDGEKTLELIIGS